MWSGGRLVRGAVNLQWRPAARTVFTSEIVSIGLYAVSDDPQGDELLSALDVVFSWDPNILALRGVDDRGAVTLLASDFPTDPFNLNETPVPQDGDGLYQALANLGDPVTATPAGTLITTFQFIALAGSAGSDVVILARGGTPTPASTVVWDGAVPNTPVTGTLDTATVSVRVRGDFDGDLTVSLADLPGFQSCMTGPDGPAAGDCDAARFDEDKDVDLIDWAAFQMAVTGSR